MTIDYLAVGTVTEDVWPDGITPGGTVMYSARAALAFTPGVVVLTAAAASFDMQGAFPDMRVHRLDTPRTTQFENRYAQITLADGSVRSTRTQIVRPAPIVYSKRNVPAELRDCRIAHLAPLCNEIHPDIVRAFTSETFIGMTPQGWLRRWDDQGRVTQHAANWEDATTMLKLADAVVMSNDDIEGDWEVARDWAGHARLMIVTQGPLGCTAFMEGTPYHVPAPQVREVDPTGAGDIFAAALFIRLAAGDDPLRACAFANCIAAKSVTRPRMEGLPRPDEVRGCAEHAG